MNKILTKLFLLFVFSTFSLVAKAQVESIIGHWITINDKTHLPQAVVHIAQAEDGYYYGKIRKLYDKKGCLMNAPYPDEMKKFIGMTVLMELEPHGKDMKGKAVDPGNGKIYHGKASYDAKTDCLMLRGSIDKWGILGRSQTWVRFKE